MNCNIQSKSADEMLSEKRKGGDILNDGRSGTNKVKEKDLHQPQKK